MAEDVLASLQYLKSLPDGHHWFCPRISAEDSGVYYDEDLEAAGLKQESQERDGQETDSVDKNPQVDVARQRKQHFQQAVQVLAYDSDTATVHQQWLKESLHKQLQGCDVCVREFHRGRKELYSKMQADYEEDAVAQFMNTFDDMNLDRIENGLTSARTSLSKLPASSRAIQDLSRTEMFAMLEALNCEILLVKESLLTEYFDPPFTMAQVKKKINLASCTPAMTIFLFSANPVRKTWADRSWTKFKRNITGAEFEWSVKPYLSAAMQRVLMEQLEIDFQPIFWHAVALMSKKISKGVITHHIRGLEVDLFKLMLEHFKVNSPGFDDLMATFTELLRTSAEDFWDAMGTIPPSTVADQILISPAFEKRLMKLAEDVQLPVNIKEEPLFAWIEPFIHSVKSGNRPQACRSILNQMLDRFQRDKYSSSVHQLCWNIGLWTLSITLDSMVNKESQVSAVSTADLMECINGHKQAILKVTVGSSDSEADHPALLSELGRSCVRMCFALHCRVLESDHTALFNKEKIYHDYSEATWSVLNEAVKETGLTNVNYAAAILLGFTRLVNLEPFIGRQALEDRKAYNNALEKTFELCRTVFENLSDYEPNDLKPFFHQQECTIAVFNGLCSGNENVSQAAGELVKLSMYEDSRREALHRCLADKYDNYDNFLTSFANATTQYLETHLYLPMPRIQRVGADLLDCLCNPEDGMLRFAALDPKRIQATERLWQALWKALACAFARTEQWNNDGYDKTELTEFCRRTMDHADNVFNQYPIFVGAMIRNGDVVQEDVQKVRRNTQRRLLQLPTTALNKMLFWLRLRDDFLIEKCVSLVSNLLLRLRDVEIKIENQSREYIQDVLSHNIRTKLSPTQEAQLLEALENHTGEEIKIEPSESRHATKEESKKKTQASISNWTKTGVRPEDVKIKSVESERKSRASPKPGDRATALIGRQVAGALGRPAPKTVKQEDPNEFLKKRKAAQEEQKRKNAEAIAKARTIAAEGKNKQSEMMVSSESESSSESDDEGPKTVGMDREMFGKPTHSKAKKAEKPLLPAGPVKKVRINRSAKDMRARLAPDLAPLHKVLLQWDYFHEGELPPTANHEQYRKVDNKFPSPHHYQETFRPLLLLEAWQGMVRAREENTSRPFAVKILSRANVDTFVEITLSVQQNTTKDLVVLEGDILLVGKASDPTKDATIPHCFLRVGRVNRKKEHIEVICKTQPGQGNSMIPQLTPDANAFAIKVTSLIPLEREYGALLSLQYYDLCDEICKAKPSPLMDYSDQKVAPLMEIYSLNKAQAKAVCFAMDNDGFSLIQGPPGSGKTKTITAIVGALLSDALKPKQMAQEIRPMVAPKPGNNINDAPAKKLLVCAPSNAAVDELVMRFKQGVRTTNGKSHKITVVRLGRTDVINAAVQDVTLEELVKERLGAGADKSNKAREEREKRIQEHKSLSEKLRELRDQETKGEVKDSVGLRESINNLRHQLRHVGNLLDSIRDEEKNVSRQAEIDRKRAQQAVLDSAHVICATLSGSGHDMFQSLNIEFETVIVDEAAQCVEMSALIPLKYGCAKCILVGDPKQLPPTVLSREAASYQYEQSLFVRMQANHPKDVHLLDTQYRMHPDISAFPRQTFYDGKLLDGGDMAALRRKPWHANPLFSPYRFYNIEGQHSSSARGRSLINLAEIEAAIALYDKLTSEYRDYRWAGKIGIITTYKGQLREMKDRFARKYGQRVLEDVEFNTTDAFQGREAEVIIFSCVRANHGGGIGFLQDIRRMNVGLTRAMCSLWVLGNSESLKRGEFWRKLIEDAIKRDRYSKEDLRKLLRANQPLMSPTQAVPTHPKAMRENGGSDVPMTDAKAPRRPAEQGERSASVEAKKRKRSGTNGEHPNGTNARPAQQVQSDAPPTKPRPKPMEDVEMVDAPESRGRTPDSGAATPRTLESVASRDSSRSVDGQRLHEDRRDAAAGHPQSNGRPPGHENRVQKKKRPPPNPLLNSRHKPNRH